MIHLIYSAFTGRINRNYGITFLIIAILSSHPAIYATNETPRATIQRTNTPPRIDGNLSDAAWQTATLVSDFRQYSPVFNADPGLPTRVFLLYDDEAIYIGAELSDPNPDSIARQLGERDNDDLNADYFGIAFDTYNNQQDAYYFSVSASGIQVDGRVLDGTYDAVWESSVRITDKGWIAEFKIPYSALRFPKKELQDWGMQIYRRIRRTREEDQWSPEEKGAGKSLVYWGKLMGFENIKPPVRLSFTPYVSSNFQYNNDPATTDKSLTTSYNGGMDIKYGLNESFTMDMILLPDFSQVQSDKIQKNLTALELVYDENRTFFNEGTDLFEKGDLFYSRRIGRTPLLFYSVYDSLRGNEIISKDPVSARLLNAVKFSGRTAGGLGLGLFNAVTGNTWATATDTLNGETRKILTDPLTNYNIVVADQALPNNSSVYIINTNVTRPSGWDDSNVTGAGTTLGTKSKTYFLGLSFAASKWNLSGPLVRYPWGDRNPGYSYSFYFLKNRGKFQFSVYQSALDKHFNINDLGINRTNNLENRGIYLSYRIYEPFGNLLNFAQSIAFDQTRSLDSKKNINTNITYKGNTTFRNYLSVWWGVTVSPSDRYDFYEPRLSGRYYIAPGYVQGWVGYSSDYRRTLALDGQIYYTRDLDLIRSYLFDIQPIIRFNNRFSVSHKISLGFNPGDLGYVYQSAGNIWFGRRDIRTMENTFSGRYMISRLISASLAVRHFWQRAAYSEYFYLEESGHLTPEPEYPYDHSYNYNYFSVDMVLGWEFAPGSMLNLVWKNAIQAEDNLYDIHFGENLNNLFGSPQLNVFSIKAIYHLDYLQLKRNRKH